MRCSVKSLSRLYIFLADSRKKASQTFAGMNHLFGFYNEVRNLSRDCFSTLKFFVN